MRIVKDRKIFLCFLLTSFLLTGCKGQGNGTGKNSVIIPKADGKETLLAENFVADISHLDLGYMMVCYTGSAEKIFLQLTGEDQTEYKYFMEPSEEYVTIPFTSGDGEYYLCVYENTGNDRYSPILSQMLTVELKNEFGPFLCPNQYVNFTMEDEAIIWGEELLADIADDLEKVQEVYHWVVRNVEYDYDKAVNVSTGYLPDLNQTLRTKMGICFDYAALMSGILRSQGIPTKLEIGYLTADVYHAWISVWLEESGWVDNIIQFNGTEWELMDPTVASTSGNQEVQERREEGDYIVRYVR